MRGTFVHNWKAVLFRGAAGVLFGASVLPWHDIALPSLVVLFGAYSLLDGGIAVLTGARPRPLEIGCLLEGLMGMGFGLFMLFHSGIAIATLAHVVAFWALVTGVLEVSEAVHLRREAPGELSLGFAGVASLLLGVAIVLWPAPTAFVFVTAVGCYGLLFGIAMLTLAYQLRKISIRFEAFHGKHLERGSRRSAPHRARPGAT